MTLYRMELDDEFGEPYYVEASPGEIRVAARPHADLEAAAQAIAGLDRETWEAWLEKAAYPDPNMAATVRWHRERARAALDAALGADDE